MCGPSAYQHRDDSQAALSVRGRYKFKREESGSDELVTPDDIDPHPYQEAAIWIWMDAGGHGILSIATDTGRAITALAAATRLAAFKDGRSQILVGCLPPYW